jgi:hypothetical protein
MLSKKNTARQPLATDIGDGAPWARGRGGRGGRGVSGSRPGGGTGPGPSAAAASGKMPEMGPEVGGAAADLGTRPGALSGWHQPLLSRISPFWRPGARDATAASGRVSYRPQWCSARAAVPSGWPCASLPHCSGNLRRRRPLQVRALLKPEQLAALVAYKQICVSTECCCCADMAVGGNLSMHTNRAYTRCKRDQNFE